MLTTTTITMSQADAIAKRIDALYAKLRAVLRELCGKDDLRGTAWHADRMELAESLRGRIRDAEMQLAELS